MIRALWHSLLRTVDSTRVHQGEPALDPRNLCTVPLFATAGHSAPLPLRATLPLCNNSENLVFLAHRRQAIDVVAPTGAAGVGVTSKRAEAVGRIVVSRLGPRHHRRGLLLKGS